MANSLKLIANSWRCGMSTQRKRGGQPGNQNAFKHGYYSEAFKKADQIDLDLAAGVEGFDEEIALLRFKIKKAVVKGNTKQLMPLVKAAGALEKLIRTDYKINGKTRHQIDAFKNIMRKMFIPLGGEKLSFQAIKNWCGFTDEECKTYFAYSDPKTNQPRAEAGLTENEKPKTESPQL
jgi:hypothetical protein